VAALALASCGPTVPGEEEEEEEEEEEVEGVVITLSLGETYQKPEEVAVTVSSGVLITDSYEYYDEATASMLSKEASPGMSFLIATAEIENLGSSRRMREGYRKFHVYDSEGSLYMWSAYYGEDPLRKTYGIPEGGKIEGKMLFDIQEGASGLTIAYMDLTYPPEPKRIAEWEIE